MPKRRSFTKEFKAEAVRLLEQSGEPAAELAWPWRTRLADVLDANGKTCPPEPSP